MQMEQPLVGVSQLLLRNAPAHRDTAVLVVKSASRDFTEQRDRVSDVAKNANVAEMTKNAKILLALAR